MEVCAMGVGVMGGSVGVGVGQGFLPWLRLHLQCTGAHSGFTGANLWFLFLRRLPIGKRI